MCGPSLILSHRQHLWPGADLETFKGIRNKKTALEIFVVCCLSAHDRFEASLLR